MGKWKEITDDGRKAFDRMVRNMECEVIVLARENERLRAKVAKLEERLKAKEPEP